MAFSSHPLLCPRLESYFLIESWIPGPNKWLFSSWSSFSPKSAHCFSRKDTASACETAVPSNSHWVRSWQPGTGSHQTVGIYKQSLAWPCWLFKIMGLIPIHLSQLQNWLKNHHVKKKKKKRELASGFFSDAIVLWNSRPAFKLFAASTTNSYFLRKRIKKVCSELCI